MMAKTDIDRFLEAVEARLTESDLSTAERYRWQGALSALEAVLGRESSLIPGVGPVG